MLRQRRLYPILLTLPNALGSGLRNWGQSGIRTIRVVLVENLTLPSYQLRRRQHWGPTHVCGQVWGLEEFILGRISAHRRQPPLQCFLQVAGAITPQKLQGAASLQFLKWRVHHSHLRLEFDMTATSADGEQVEHVVRVERS